MWVTGLPLSTYPWLIHRDAGRACSRCVPLVPVSCLRRRRRPGHVDHGRSRALARSCAAGVLVAIDQLLQRARGGRRRPGDVDRGRSHALARSCAAGVLVAVDQLLQRGPGAGAAQITSTAADRASWPGQAPPACCWPPTRCCSVLEVAGAARVTSTAANGANLARSGAAGVLAPSTSCCSVLEVVKQFKYSRYSCVMATDSRDVLMTL